MLKLDLDLVRSGTLQRTKLMKRCQVELVKEHLMEIEP
jgi:hypothetical protein